MCVSEIESRFKTGITDFRWNFEVPSFLWGDRAVFLFSFYKNKDFYKRKKGKPFGVVSQKSWGFKISTKISNSDFKTICNFLQIYKDGLTTDDVYKCVTLNGSHRRLVSSVLVPRTSPYVRCFFDGIEIT